MNKPGKSFARPLSDLLHKTLTDAFAKQGFASSELVTRWAEIVGAEIAAHSEPEKIQWTRAAHGHTPEPGTLVLRVEGPAAIEIQHLSGVVLERVRQAPLRRREQAPQPAGDPEAAARIAADLPEIADESLRAALGRLGAAIKQS